MSVALQAVRLSAAIGGIGAFALLAPAVALQGLGVLWGFLAALWLLALPLYLAEATLWRLHGAPLLTAISAHVRRGHLHAGWNVATGLVLVVVLLLAALAALGAVAVASQAAQVVSAPEQAAAWSFAALGPRALLLLGLFWALAVWPSAEGRRAFRGSHWLHYCSRVGTIAATVLVLLGTMHLSRSEAALWDVAEQGLGERLLALQTGFSLGVLSSHAALGVFYTACARLPRQDAQPARGLTRLALGLCLGLSLWALGMVGWYAELGAALATHPPGLPQLLALFDAETLRPQARLGAILVALVVLWLSARVLADVVRHSLETLLGGRVLWAAALVGAAGVALSLGLYWGWQQPLDSPRWALSQNLSAMVSRVLLPLAAILMTGVISRGLPPGPMLWSQRLPLPLAAPLYLYWRYPARFWLLLVLLHISGAAEILWNFWIASPYVGE